MDISKARMVLHNALQSTPLDVAWQYKLLVNEVEALREQNGTMRDALHVAVDGGPYTPPAGVEYDVNVWAECVVNGIPWDPTSPPPSTVP